MVRAFKLMVDHGQFVQGYLICVLSDYFKVYLCEKIVPRGDNIYASLHLKVVKTFLPCRSLLSLGVSEGSRVMMVRSLGCVHAVNILSNSLH